MIRWPQFSRILALSLLVVNCVSGAPDEIGFNRDVRPILSNNCFYCHGPDEKKREADLRLDTREGAIAENDGVRAIVPGKPDESELMVRILTHDRDEVMPPPKSKKPAITTAQAEILRKWIEQGAKYESHWAFMPLDRTAPPAVKNPGWVKNPIDQFVLARLEREGITPSLEADPATLCRRLYLDLTGLLPTPEEVSAFTQSAVRDPQAAIDALVDRLLASPHYGERWGRHWLDQARYADSNGYTIDNDRGMWPFRDWVIKAHNDDLPFDQFTIEQLAGDLLPNATKSQRIATAFHRNTLINEEGGVDKEQFRNEAVVDRVNTTGAVWLGLTVGCAQCHTHKFDPITHREYFELFSFFNQGTDVNNKGETIKVVRGEVFGQPIAPPPPNVPPAPELARQQAEWEKAELARLSKNLPEGAPVKWTPAKYEEYDTASGAGFELLPDNSLLADGRGAFNDTYRVVAKSPLKKIAAVRLRALTHESLPKQGPGMAGNGNFVLTEFEASLGGEALRFARAFADHEQPNYPASALIDGDAKSGWAINVAKGATAKMNADHEAVLIFAKPLEPGEAGIEFKLRHELNEKYLLGRFAIEFSEAAPAGIAKADDALLAALKVPEAKRNAAQRKTILTTFQKIAPQSKAQPADPNVAELMVMKETDTPRTTLIHLRGDFLRLDEKTGPLQPGGLSAVPPALPAAAGRTRLDLAKWLVSSDNPLTPRVTMNRTWMRYFGRGLVETDEDFGTQGSPPTHPELLDWLARTFVERGWSMKAMHRLIATSATYRQSSAARPDLVEKDPRNLLLARQERVRVEAEIVRDAALSASGLLDRTIGGPSVRPPQAEGVYAFTQNRKKWNADTGADRFRRALYTQFYRAAPYPLFTTFDAPDFQTVCTRRVRSNTPLQALTVANDPAFVEIAVGLAKQTLQDVGPAAHADDPQPLLDRTFARALSRAPSASERQILRDYFTRQLTAFRQEPATANALLPADGSMNAWPPELAAAMISVARTLFNTDNFITRD